MGGGGGELGKETDGKKQTLGLLGMVAIGFFWVSGGVYANEPLVNSCPPGFVFLGLVGWYVFRSRNSAANSVC